MANKKTVLGETIPHLGIQPSVWQDQDVIIRQQMAIWIMRYALHRTALTKWNTSKSWLTHCP